jgi:hypothetical protein
MGVNPQVMIKEALSRGGSQPYRWEVIGGESGSFPLSWGGQLGEPRT